MTALTPTAPPSGPGLCGDGGLELVGGQAVGLRGIFVDIALLCPDGALTIDEFSACCKR